MIKAILALLFLPVLSQAKSIELTTHNHCSLQDEVSYETMFELKQCLAKQVAKRKFTKYPIYLVIDSPGGDIYEGLRFIEFAKTIPDLHTVTIFAASMGAEIVQALPGKRYGLDSSITMFHRARGGFSGQFEDGELEKRLRLWKAIVRKMEQTAADRIGISLATYKARVKDEWWLYSQENVKAKVLDESVKMICSEALQSSVKTKKIETMFGPYEYQVSACPLMN